MSNLPSLFQRPQSSRKQYEFEKYRIVQDRLFVSDFDKFLDAIEQ